MNMREIMRLVEGPVDSAKLDDALFWVQRWVSGSIDDPDWSEGEEDNQFSCDQAFAYLQQTIGAKKVSGKPLWRYLALSKAAAVKMKTTKMLDVHSVSYQSFTTSEKLANDVADFLDRPGKIQVIVAVQPEPSQIVWSFPDLKANQACRSMLMALGDWEFQDEVCVRVDRPLPILDVKVLT